MAVITVPSFAPRTSHRRALAALLLFMFLGLVSQAAVATLQVDCRDELLTGNGAVLTADDGKTLLTTGRQQCQLTGPGGLRLPLPAWAQAIMSGARIFS